MSENTMDLQEKLQRLMWLGHLYQQKNHEANGPMSNPQRGQGRVLAVLKMQEEISTKDLAYVLGIRTQSLNELLGKLEKNGYITRTQSENDKRVVLVSLTEMGKNEKQEESEFQGILNCLNENEQKSFGAYLDRIIAEFEAQVGNEPDDSEFEWMRIARERFGENFDKLISMRRGGNPFRGGFGERGGFDHGGGFGGFPRGRHDRDFGTPPEQPMPPSPHKKNQ